MTTISSNYLYNSLVQPIQQTQSMLNTLTTETSTGQYANLGLQLGSQSGYELSLKNQYNELQSYTASNSMLDTNLSAAYSALGTIQTNAQSTLQSLTAWQTGETNSGSTLQSLGSSALQSLNSAANTTSSGEYVFGGINSGAQPLATYYSTPQSSAQQALQSAFVTQFGTSPSSAAAASITPSQMQSFLSTAFGVQFQGSNWTTNWSSASSTNQTADIAPNLTVQASVNVNQPGFSQLAEGYAMLAEFGGGNFSSSTQQTIASTATTLISQGLSDITDLQSQVGSIQGQVKDANTSISSQSSILETQIGNLDNVDQYQVATQLSTLSTQLETAYSLTARLQQMNLAQYLPVP